MLICRASCCSSKQPKKAETQAIINLQRVKNGCARERVASSKKSIAGNGIHHLFAFGWNSKQPERLTDTKNDHVLRSTASILVNCNLVCILVNS